MTAEFNWWLLIVGLVIGAALVWLVLADSSRRESEISAEELPKEAAWISATLGEGGRPLEPDLAEAVLQLHRVYLRSLPPDSDDAWADDVPETGGEMVEARPGAPPAGDDERGSPVGRRGDRSTPPG